MIDVVVVGSANLDLVATAERLPGAGETVLGSSYHEHPGGKGLNQAVAAARCGATVAMIGSVGDDEAGTRLRATASDAGVDVTGLGVKPGVATGRAVITIDRHAENCIVVVPGANAADVSAEPPPARVVLAQLEIPVTSVIAAFAAARSSRAVTILNPAPASELPDRLLDLCDIVVPNEHELDLVGGADHLLSCGVGAVVVTRGAAGVTVVEADDRTGWSVPAYAVEPIDTTGAGDAFCGALASRLAAGDDLRTAVQFAAAAGALATTTAGAVPSLPTAEAVRSLMAQG